MAKSPLSAAEQAALVERLYEGFAAKGHLSANEREAIQHAVNVFCPNIELKPRDDTSKDPHPEDVLDYIVTDMGSRHRHVTQMPGGKKSQTSVGVFSLPTEIDNRRGSPGTPASGAERPFDADKTIMAQLEHSLRHNENGKDLPGGLNEREIGILTQAKEALIAARHVVGGESTLASATSHKSSRQR